jgi:hypothetical protein
MVVDDAIDAGAADLAPMAEASTWDREPRGSADRLSGT